MEIFQIRNLRWKPFFPREDSHPHPVWLENIDGNVVCAVCEKLVVDSGFSCPECDIFFHMLCIELSNKDPYQALIVFHLGQRHDGFIFTQELENDDGKEDVRCFGCEEPVVGPGYKCSACECALLLHESCAKLPTRISFHEFHRTPGHDSRLYLEPPTNGFRCCDACGKRGNRCFFYSCGQCDFKLDTTCATRPPSNSAKDCRHKFLPLFKQIHFTCEACGEEGNNFANICTICRLFIHPRCAGFPPTTRISRHDHPLTLIYYLPQVKDTIHEFCKLCDQKVNTEYAAYCCLQCSYVAHLKCAGIKGNTLDVEESSELATNDMEEIINLGEIHEHNLILSHEESVDLVSNDREDKLCDGCMQFIISTPFYSCTLCNFFLHLTCARLPKKKRHLLHHHELSLHTDKHVFLCDACGQFRQGFVYRCDPCMGNYNFDLLCCSIPETVKHKGHQHSLFHIESAKKCQACDDCSHNGRVLVCYKCDFALGFKCATLPPLVRHKYDDHLLALTYTVENDSKEYYCLICEEERNPNHWFYYCTKCSFPAHPQCVLGKYPYIKLGTTLTYEKHKHPVVPVFRKIESCTPCDNCGFPLGNIGLECTQCKFSVHFAGHRCLGRKLLEKMRIASLVSTAAEQFIDGIGGLDRSRVRGLE